MPRERWKYYYGSPYNSYQRRALEREVQPEGYRKVFEDKAVCAMLCRGAGVRTPATYGVVRPGSPYRRKLREWCLESPSRSVVVKPVLGSKGRGVHVISEVNGTLIVSSQNGPCPLAQYELAEASVVQETVRQHKELADFAPASLNTIRVVTLSTKSDGVIIVHAFIRFGDGTSVVDNWSRGGIVVRVDLDTGRLLPGARDRWNRQYLAHPKSGKPFGDFRIPSWQKVASFAIEIQRAFDFYPLFGSDIAVSEDGEPVLIEINANPDLDGVEAGPFLADERVLKAFGEYGLLINRQQRRLYKDLLSRRSHVECRGCQRT